MENYIMRNAISIALIATVFILPSCSRKESSQQTPGRPIVFVSVLPQAYLAERIAGGHASVEALVPPGQEPHTYEPTPKQMTRLSGAHILFRVGVPFEDTLLHKLGSAKQLRIVDTRKGVTLILSTDEDEPGMDPHIWMSARLAKVQAKTICETLIEIDPAHKADYENNLQQLDADLDHVDAQIAASLASLKGKTFFVFHPAFGYFAKDYGLKQEAVETGGKTPGPKHVKELIDKAKSEGVRVIFVEPQFSQHAAAAISQQIGGGVIAIDPLSKDYIANLQEVARKIHDALAPTASSTSGS